MTSVRAPALRLALPLLALAVPLALAGCGSGPVAGTYKCNGIPGSDTLILGSDGTAIQQGLEFGHVMVGTGTYTADSDKVSVIITSLTSDGSKTDIPQDRTKTLFERQSSGDLKWILSTCSKV